MDKSKVIIVLLVLILIGIIVLLIRVGFPRTETRWLCGNWETTLPNGMQGFDTEKCVNDCASTCDKFGLKYKLSGAVTPAEIKSNVCEGISCKCVCSG